MDYFDCRLYSLLLFKRKKPLKASNIITGLKVIRTEQGE